MKKNKGFTLIELLLVVGFSSLATTGIYLVFNKTQTISMANDEVKSLGAFKDAIISAYEDSSSYSGLDNASLNTARITPVEMTNGNAAEIINPFGGLMTVTPINFGGFTNTGFRITYPGMISAVCPTVIVGLANSFDVITVNGTVVKTFGGTIAPPTLATACSSAASFTVLFEVISSQKQAAIAATPPVAPSSATSFNNITTPLICNFEDTGFNYGSASIPHNIRNEVIMTYRGIDNHVGRCPNSSEYNPWIDRINTEKSANPALSYQDIFTNIVEPEMISSGTNSYTKASRITAANTECQTAATPTYGALGATARYKLFSGNKCII